jgi:hypothetical protein
MESIHTELEPAPISFASIDHDLAPDMTILPERPPTRTEKIIARVSLWTLEQ